MTQGVTHGYLLVRDRAEAAELKPAIERYVRRKLSDYRFAGTYVDGGPEHARKRFFDRLAAKVLLDRLQRGDVVVFSSLAGCLPQHADRAHMLQYFGGIGIGMHFIEEDIVAADRESAENLSRALKSIQKTADEPRRRKIRETLARNKAAGQPVNGESPLGFRWVGRKGAKRLVVDEEEQHIMWKIVAMRQKGFSFPEIFARLRADGVTHRRRRNGQWVRQPWSESKIRRAHDAALRMKQEAATRRAAGND